MAAAIAFWFEFGSNYSYLSLMRIEALAKRAGVALRYDPFLLGPVFRALGWQAGTQAIKDALRARTARARALGIFGAPTFIVAGKIFWGNDRLENALDYAQSLRT